MFHLASLATTFVLVLSCSTGLSRGEQIRDCPAASLSCEKSKNKDNEYTCRVGAPRIPGYDPPRFSWSVTAGRVVDGDATDATRIIDVGGVDADVVTVTVEIKLGLPGCDSARSSVLKLH